MDAGVGDRLRRVVEQVVLAGERLAHAQAVQHAPVLCPHPESSTVIPRLSRRLTVSTRTVAPVASSVTEATEPQPQTRLQAARRW
jgi:hypothetical protein